MAKYELFKKLFYESIKPEYSWLSEQGEAIILSCARSGLIDVPLRPPILILMCPGEESYKSGKAMALSLAKTFRIAHYSEEILENRDSIYKPSAKYPYIISTSEFKNPWDFYQKCSEILGKYKICIIHEMHKISFLMAEAFTKLTNSEWKPRPEALVICLFNCGTKFTYEQLENSCASTLVESLLEISWSNEPKLYIDDTPLYDTLGHIVRNTAVLLPKIKSKKKFGSKIKQKKQNLY